MQCIYCRGNNLVIEDKIENLVKLVCLNPDCGKAIIYTMKEAKELLEEKESKTKIELWDE